MRTILLIDDDQKIRLTFSIALRDKGYHVIEADSGSLGLELARRHLPDLILTDINMPGGDGQDLLHHIRNNRELCAKQVVFMTGRPDVVTPRKGMEEGADDFLVKPVTLDALFSCVAARLKRGQESWRIEELLQILLKNVPDHIYFKDSESRYIQINPSLVKRFGLRSTEEAIGKTDFDFYSREYAALRPCA